MVRSRDEDHASALLWELGTRGIEVRDVAPGDSALLAYFEPRPALFEELSAALATLEGARIEPAGVPDVDWLARFRESFRPFAAGGFLVAPAWDVPSVALSRVLVVDPGPAFGTGTHESTRLCLALLEDLVPRRRPRCVADVGAGTGILGIAAAKLGAAAVVALDDDPLALESARHHARLNGTPLRLVRADGARCLRSGCFDMVVANLTAPLLAARREELTALLSPGASLILAGLLASELPELRAAYSGAGSLRERRLGEWAAVWVEGQ